MDIGSIFLIFALFILVAWFVLRPVLEQKPQLTTQNLSAAEHELSGLLAERDRIIRTLQELDFDQALGKIPAEDYAPQRALFVQQGAQVLRRLDEIQAGESSGQATEGIEARLEAVILARRADSAQPTAANGDGVTLHPADDAIEVALANRRRARQSKTAGFCPQCGGAIQKTDRFCPKCGQKMS